MKRLKFRSFHAHEFANSRSWFGGILWEETKFHRFVESSASRHLFIISIKGKRPEAQQRRALSSRLSCIHASVCVYVWRVFSVCNLSSFEGGKGNVCFLILTCHLRSWIMYAAYAPTLTDHLEYVVRIYRNDTTGYSSLPYFQTLCKRSWVIISQREISREFVLSREIFIDASFSWKSFSIRRSRSVVLIIHL